MKKQLSKHGNSLALVIDKPILKLLKIDELTELNLSISNNSLVITPTKKKSNSSLQKKKRSTLAIANKIMKDHNETFKKLAKT